MADELKQRETVVLGGRTFNVIDFERRTVMQDHYLARLVRSTGLDRIMPMDGQSDKAYLIRLQTVLLDSGRAHELIAGYLLPEGKTEQDWTQDIAKDIAKHVGRCNTEADRDLVLTLAMQCCFGFFRQGLAHLKLLESSSDVRGPTKNASPQPTAH